MKFAIAIAFVTLLGCASRPARAADAPAASGIPSLAAIRASMLASDSIMVARVELDTRVIADTAGRSRSDLVSKRVAVKQVKGPWMQRLVANLLPEGTGEPSAEVCPPPRVPAGLDRPWMLTALWINKTGRGQVYLNLINGCGTIGLAGGKPGGIALRAHTDSLLALFQQALYADTSLRALSGRGLPDTSRSARVSSVETFPEAIERVPPVYPDSARAAGIQGVVIVRALVGTDGGVKKAEIMTSVPALDEAALAAVKLWRFKPATAGGEPRSVWVSIPVSFRLRPDQTGTHP